MARKVKQIARFKDRLNAGAELAAELARHVAGEDPVVLAIPPDGVPIAASVAVALPAPLDLMAAQRIVAPGHESDTLGAVTPDRTLIINRPLVDRLGLSDEAVEAMSIPAWSAAQRTLSTFRGNRAQTDVRGRTVVLVDDGITTGYTMMAAVISARKLEPARVMVAVPVATLEAIERLSAAVDDLLALEISVEGDFSVERYYESYEKLAERDVIWTLENLWRERPPAGYSETF